MRDMPWVSFWNRTGDESASFLNKDPEALCDVDVFPNLLRSRYRLPGATFVGRLSRVARSWRRELMTMAPWTHPFGGSYLDAVEYYLSKGRPVHTATYTISISDLSIDEDRDVSSQLVENILGLGARQLYQQEEYQGSDRKPSLKNSSFLLGEHYICLEHGLHQTKVHVVGSDRDQVVRIIDDIRVEVKKPKQNKLLSLVSGSGGLQTRAIGECNTNFEPLNYNPKMVASYEHLLTCLDSKDPCGRMVIIDGPPGTGKTYLVRSIISSVEATFLMVPNTLFHQLSGPNLLPVLLNARGLDRPLILIIEDADRALVDRRNGSLEALSEILNLSDGILGEMLDVRIIATTNVERINLDKAIFRAGRLCTHLFVDVLEAEQAGEIYARLTGKDLERQECNTLAEVYRLAREDGWEPKKNDEVVGQYL